ncbi:MAG: hypothetical protein V3U76_10830 [Granulosicoccus sp.]
MNNAKVLWAIIVLLLAVLGFMAFKFVSGATEPYEDGRTSVVLTADERNLILDEMRQFLVSVQAVSQAITESDMEKVGHLAHKAGMAAEEGTPGALLRKIPLSMKKMGFGVRGQFDEISKLAKSGSEAAIVRKKLDALMQTCIACHNLYRLPEPQQ